MIDDIYSVMPLYGVKHALPVWFIPINTAEQKKEKREVI